MPAPTFAGQNRFQSISYIFTKFSSSFVLIASYMKRNGFRAYEKLNFLIQWAIALAICLINLVYGETYA